MFHSRRLSKDTNLPLMPLLVGTSQGSDRHLRDSGHRGQGHTAGFEPFKSISIHLKHSFAPKDCACKRYEACWNIACARFWQILRHTSSKSPRLGAGEGSEGPELRKHVIEPLFLAVEHVVLALWAGNTKCSLMWGAGCSQFHGPPLYSPFLLQRAYSQ